MREENRRNERKVMSLIRTKRISVIGFLVATILLSLAIFLAMRDEKTEVQAKLKPIGNTTTISASSKIGKNINEVEKEATSNNEKENTVETVSEPNVQSTQENLTNENQITENASTEPTSEVNSENANKENDEIEDKNQSESNESNQNTDTKSIATSANVSIKKTESKEEANSNQTSSNPSTSSETSSNETNSKFIKPIDGETSKPFYMDRLIYSETLQEWTTHRGIDIKAQKNDEVKIIADGTVKSIKTDPRYGISVIIKHKNGFESVYACLLNSAENLKEGDEVAQGQTIGNVGNSGVFETTDGMHLHFELLKDGEYVNPELYLK